MDGLLEARWNTLSWLLQDTPCSPGGEFYSGVFGEFTTDTNTLVALQLDEQTHKALIAAEIITLDDLFMSSNTRLATLQGLHAGSLGNINHALISLLNAIDGEGHVDWFAYWRYQHIQILPITTDISPEEMVEKLPLIVQEVLHREYNERAGIVIKHRYGLEDGGIRTLEEVGQACGGLSRERVRQLEKKALKKLRGILIEQKYAGRDYHVHPLIHVLIQAIYESIEAEPSKLLIETTLLERVGHVLALNVEKVKQILFQFLPLLGVERVEFDYPHALAAWGYREEANLSLILYGVKCLDELLTRKTSLPQFDGDILLTLNQEGRKTRKLTSTQFAWLIRLCHTVERREDGLIQGKFAYLKGRGNQVERLLSEAGTPLSVAELVREINHRLVPPGQQHLTESNLTSQMTCDERFVPLGRSGYWGLQSWTHIDTKTIFQLMEECFLISKQPVTFDEIFLYVRTRRPVSKHSILWHLKDKTEIFVKMSATTWGLVQWLEQTSYHAWNREQAAELIATLFQRHQATELDYTLLKEELSKETGLSVTHLQGVLRQNPAIKVYASTLWSKTRIAVFQHDYKATFAQARTASPHNLVSRHTQLCQEVRALLDAAPENQMTMVEVIHRLYERTGCQPKTLYAAIARMGFVEKKAIPGSSRKVCQLKQEAARRRAGRGSLYQSICLSVKSTLEDQPNKQMPLADLAASLKKEHKAPKGTVYAYLSSMNFIEKLAIPGSQRKLCRLKCLPD